MNKNLVNKNEFIDRSADVGQSLNGGDESPKTIYVLSPSEDVDEIDLVQLLIPPLKYKIQCLLVILMVFLIYLIVTLLFGNLKYTNELIYKIKPLSRVQFDPMTSFYTEYELTKAKGVLGMYWDLSDINSGFALIREFDTDDSGESPNLLISNKDSKDKPFPPATYRLRATTGSNNATQEALVTLFDYFVRRNGELTIENANDQLTSLEQSKNKLLEELKSSIAGFDTIKYFTRGANQYFIVKEEESAHLVRRSDTEDRFVTFDSFFLEESKVNQAVRETSTILNLSDGIDSLPNQLENLADQFISNSQTITNIASTIQRNEMIITYLKQEELESEVPNKVNQTKMGYYRDDILKLQKSLSRLDTQNDIIRNQYNRVLLSLKTYLYLKTKYPSAEKNVWSVFNKSPLSSNSDRDGYAEEEKIARIQLGTLDSLLGDLEAITKSVISNTVEIRLIQSGELKPFEIVEPPLEEHMVSNLYYSLSPTERSRRIDSIHKAVGSKTIITILLAVSIVIALISVYLRQLAQRKDSILHNKSLIEAIKYHKL